MSRAKNIRCGRSRSFFGGARHGLTKVYHVKIPPQPSGIPYSYDQYDVQQDKLAPVLLEQHPGDEQQVIGIEDHHARQGYGYVSQVPGQGNGFLAVLPPHQQGEDQQQPPPQQVDGDGQQGCVAFLGHEFHSLSREAKLLFFSSQKAFRMKKPAAKGAAGRLKNNLKAHKIAMKKSTIHIVRLRWGPAKRLCAQDTTRRRSR